jgi:ElaB/YqjD/DUF883 family membrane-anchored ribosome-binding protein
MTPKNNLETNVSTQQEDHRPIDQAKETAANLASNVNEKMSNVSSAVGDKMNEIKAHLQGDSQQGAEEDASSTKTQGITENIGNKLSDMKTAVADKFTDVKEHFQGTTDDAKERAGNVMEQAMEYTQDIKDTTEDRAENVIERAKAKAQDIKDSAKQKAQAVTQDNRKIAAQDSGESAEYEHVGIMKKKDEIGQAIHNAIGGLLGADETEQQAPSSAK